MTDDNYLKSLEDFVSNLSDDPTSDDPITIEYADGSVSVLPSVKECAKEALEYAQYSSILFDDFFSEFEWNDFTEDDLL